MPSPASRPRFTQITAHFELITPAFVGGADHACAGLDPKSIKAALRFWWRVLNAGHIAHDCRDSKMLHHLHQQEMRLFGVEGSEKAGGQGLLHLALRNTKNLTKDMPLEPGINYLAGQGLTKYDNTTRSHKLLRQPLAEHAFELDLVFFQPGADAPEQADIDSIKQALIAFGLLGGLGSRKNRGFGSVALRKITQKMPATAGEVPDLVEHIATTEEQYRVQLEEIFSRQHPQLPLLPSVSQDARCRILFAANGISVPPATQNRRALPLMRQPDTAFDLLNLIGEQFMLERSWGRFVKPGAPHETSGNYLAEQNYKGDHDFIKAATGAPDYPQPEANAIPQRSIYGLPYRFDKSNEMNLRLRDENGGWESTRRGSPFHIHIHKLAGKPVAVLYTLPSLFCPVGQQIEMGKNLAMRHTGSVRFDYTTIDKFLQRFSSAHTIR